MRIFITGSADGLGLAAARRLLDEGHTVVLHARSKERSAAIGDLGGKAHSVVIGDLSSRDSLRSLADQVNAIGPMDTIIHNAGIYLEPQRGETPEGHAKTLAVNTLAPYLLTGWITRPKRLVYLTSGLHRSGSPSLDDIDWRTRQWSAGQAYAESKLHVATLAAAVARHWPDVISNAVDPGWVPTKMGGPGATDNLEMGHLTQCWLAASADPAAQTSGGYWYHRERQKAAGAVTDHAFQDRLVDTLADLTGVPLF